MPVMPARVAQCTPPVNTDNCRHAPLHPLLVCAVFLACQQLHCWTQVGSTRTQQTERSVEPDGQAGKQAARMAAYRPRPLPCDHLPQHHAQRPLRGGRGKGRQCNASNQQINRRRVAPDNERHARKHEPRAAACRNLRHTKTAQLMLPQPTSSPCRTCPLASRPQP